MTRTIAWATLVAGTLDILSAFVFSGAVVRVLRTVASGPFGNAVAESPAGAPLGLLVHFAIMAVMVTVYVFAARRIPALELGAIAQQLFSHCVLTGLPIAWITSRRATRS